MTGDKLYAIVDLILAVVLFLTLLLVLFAPVTARQIVRFVKTLLFGGHK
jgi:hypothetical protein